MVGSHWVSQSACIHLFNLPNQCCISPRAMSQGSQTQLWLAKKDERGSLFTCVSVYFNNLSRFRGIFFLWMANTPLRRSSPGRQNMPKGTWSGLSAAQWWAQWVIGLKWTQTAQLHITISVFQFCISYMPNSFYSWHTCWHQNRGKWVYV